MIGLLQRVRQAEVRVDGETTGAIGTGLMVLVGVEKGDTTAQSQRLSERLLSYRVFEDDTGRMNYSVSDIEGGVLLVPQFTLPADTRKGTRPSFSSAADSELGRTRFDELVSIMSKQISPLETGRFGAHMEVQLINNGPVTFWIRVDPPL